MTLSLALPSLSAAEGAPPAKATAAQAERLAQLIAKELDFVWRSLRRLGVPAAHVDDAAQHVWLIVVRKLPEITVGRERSFLFGTAIRVASEWRRKLGRSREVAATTEPVDPGPGAEELLAARRARLVLDEVLEALPDELRVVFILYELEEQTAAEIAELLALPPGTVASRLRRARSAFEAVAKRLRARGVAQGGR
jgi:RNA polymerase sigma-70 factor (ECF subfamily)